MNDKIEIAVEKFRKIVSDIASGGNYGLVMDGSLLDIVSEATGKPAFYTKVGVAGKMDIRTSSYAGCPEREPEPKHESFLATIANQQMGTLGGNAAQIAAAQMGRNTPGAFYSGMTPMNDVARTSQAEGSSE